jgi:nucleoside-diphosphate-sugar epimerase
LKVLVTGAGGFVGSQVARALLSAGHHVRAPARDGSARDAVEDVAARIEWVTADLFAGDPVALASLVRGADLCVHLAWYAVPGQYLASPENLRCVTGSLRLLEALAEAGCQRAVFVGSCFEYEFGPEPLAETSPVRPQSLYAASKLATRYMGEQLAKLRGIEFAWARLFYLYGPFEDRRRLVPAVMDALLQGQPVDVTRGTQVRDFLHVADVGAALAAVALSDLTGVVNVGSGKPVTVREVVATIESFVGRQGLVRYGARPDNPTDPPFVVADNRRLVQGTGWSPKYDLASGLRQTLEWSKTRLATR